MRLLLSIAVVMASCGSPPPSSPERGADQPASRTSPPTPPSQPAPSTPAPSVGATLADAPPWQWEGDEPGFGSSFYRAPITVDDPGGLRCLFRYEESDHTDHLECLDRSGARLWGRDRAGAFVEDAALLRRGETLFVARFSNISSGCELSAYALTTGRELWTARLLGVGEVAHSEYLNDVQLRWIDDRIVAFGWESAGQYVEALDPRSGARVAYRGPATPEPTSPTSPQPAAEPPIPGDAASFEWRWEGTPPDPQRELYTGPVLVSAPGGGACSFARDARGTHLECTDASGRRAWGDDLLDAAMSDAALTRDDQRLYVSSFSNMAAGTIVTAYDLRTGDRLWQTGLRGVGPIAHSIYLHDEQLRIERGRLVAIGWELGGRWVEVLDPLSGRDLGNRLLRESETR